MLKNVFSFLHGTARLCNLYLHNAFLWPMIYLVLSLESISIFYLEVPSEELLYCPSSVFASFTCASRCFYGCSGLYTVHPNFFKKNLFKRQKIDLWFIFAGSTSSFTAENKVNLLFYYWYLWHNYINCRALKERKKQSLKQVKKS